MDFKALESVCPDQGFEAVFSKVKKRARYRGAVKAAYQNFFEAIVHNLKKAVVILPRSSVIA